MKRALPLLSCGAALALAAAPLFAAGDIENGKTKAAACFACHGADGNAVDPQYPRLAGQYNLYLQQTLHEYKDGRRANPIMKGFAASLSDQDIEDVAAYFASLPGKVDTLHGHVQGDK
ncbi:c-type cytochrome [Frateuria defendens]|uniref:c-type cytochrome n=1 Tax=Frateuria defendens TaxID=2219559 RepID=UPI00066FF11D|nr:cytochrome c [Frateuria defendens]